MTDEEGAKLSQQEQFARHMERLSRQEPLLPELMPYLSRAALAALIPVLRASCMAG